MEAQGFLGDSVFMDPPYMGPSFRPRQPSGIMVQVSFTSWNLAPDKYMYIDVYIRFSDIP